MPEHLLMGVQPGLIESRAIDLSVIAEERKKKISVAISKIVD
jgi:hypothetical protein